ncbi:MAG: hypothetical protein V3U06_06920 [Candidatus Binatia bacterium]
MTKLLALKVAVDTHKGLREGAPRLLDLFRRKSIEVCLFVSFGPDCSGKALRRVSHPAFLLTMARFLRLTTLPTLDELIGRESDINGFL